MFEPLKFDYILFQVVAVYQNNTVNITDMISSLRSAPFNSQPSSNTSRKLQVVSTTQSEPAEESNT